MEPGCIFCKIVNNEIPSSKIIETDKVLVFLDVNPINKGHALVIAKEHYETLLDVPDNLLKDLMITAKKVARSMKKTLNAEGFNIGMNNYAAAGQTVPHAHMHVIPRFGNDGLEAWPHKKYEVGEMDKFRDKISSFIKKCCKSQDSTR